MKLPLNNFHGQSSTSKNRHNLIKDAILMGENPFTVIGNCNDGQTLTLHSSLQFRSVSQAGVMGHWNATVTTRIIDGMQGWTRICVAASSLLGLHRAFLTSSERGSFAGCVNQWINYNCGKRFTFLHMQVPIEIVFGGGNIPVRNTW